jgi:hypothetical protein
MIEIASSAFGLRLTKAQKLFERGKQRQAIQELWYAEALARGDAEAIRELLHVTHAMQQCIEPKQNSRLAELVAALEHNAKAATRWPVGTPPALAEAEPMGRPAFYLGLALSLLLAAGIGAVILFFWGFHLSNPCPCTGGFCMLGNPATGGADAHLSGGGAGIGMLCGGVGVLGLLAFLVARFRTRLAHPFLSLTVGFPVLYGVLLAAGWTVARMVWGPTRC